MEEQVELARQISHSLSADTNSTSKGQSMYVKRRNRSSKWIHEGISILHWPVSTSVPSVCQCPPPQTMSKKKKSWNIRDWRRDGFKKNKSAYVLSENAEQNVAKDLAAILK